MSRTFQAILMPEREEDLQRYLQNQCPMTTYTVQTTERNTLQLTFPTGIEATHIYDMLDYLTGNFILGSIEEEKPPVIKRANAIILRVTDTYNAFLNRGGNQGNKCIGVEKTPGQVTLGIFDEEQDLWTSLPLPDSYHVYSVRDGETTILYITYMDRPRGSSFAWEQHLDEKAIAITPLIGDNPNIVGKTYFFYKK